MQKAAGGASYASLEIRTIGPRPRVLEVEAAALPGEGPRAGVVAVFHDITERKRIEEVRRDFVANVSHELRTPLAAIRGAAETLLGGALENPDFARRFTEVIDRHSRRLEQLVMDLLSLARLESEEEKSDAADLSVRKLAESSLAAVSELAAERGVTLSSELPEQDWVVRGDRNRMEQALVNLLDNAVKYTEAGGSVVLRVYHDNGTVNLAVADSGIGIPPEALSRIFERFYRVDKGRSRDVGGTGLGLAIVKHAVQTQGGRVDVESFPGRGSTFTIRLPLHRS
jgi:two-component system phosphate regulon sensor histidine kinase PhoR